MELSTRGLSKVVKDSISSAKSGDTLSSKGSPTEAERSSPLGVDKPESGTSKSSSSEARKKSSKDIAANLEGLAVLTSDTACSGLPFRADRRTEDTFARESGKRSSAVRGVKPLAKGCCLPAAMLGATSKSLDRVQFHGRVALTTLCSTQRHLAINKLAAVV